jgi:hypothetical protein
MWKFVLPAVDPDNRLREVRTIMSSSETRKGGSMFVVQSGLAAWEDPETVADWKGKTVSIVCAKRSVAVALLWLVVASRPRRLTHVFRFYLAPLLPSMMQMQKRRLLTELKADPPGFRGTTLATAESHVCVTSALSDPSAVDPDFLTAYPRCALIETDESGLSSDSFRIACTTISELGSSGIGKLLQARSGSAVLRVLDLESYAVIQLIGPPEVCDLAVQCLSERGIERFHNIRSLPQVIASLRE